MKIECISIVDEDEYDIRNGYSVLVDGKEVINVGDGEVEDNNLSRNFNDIYKLTGLLEKVALKAPGEVEIVASSMSSEDLDEHIFTWGDND